VQALRTWLDEHTDAGAEPLLVSNRGAPPDAQGRARNIPCAVRHSAAMQLLQNGLDRTVIALWLGHESVESMQMYVHAVIKIEEQAMAKTHPVATSLGRHRRRDELLALLEGLLLCRHQVLLAHHLRWLA